MTDRRARITVEWLHDDMTPTGVTIVYPYVRVDHDGGLHPEPVPAEPLTRTGDQP